MKKTRKSDLFIYILLLAILENVTTSETLMYASRIGACCFSVALAIYFMSDIIDYLDKKKK